MHVLFDKQTILYEIPHIVYSQDGNKIPTTRCIVTNETFSCK